MINQADTAIACGRDGRRVFFDAESGEQRNDIDFGAGGLAPVGDGFVWRSDNEFIGLRADGTQVWRAQHDGGRVYPDQGIVIIGDGRVLDARTGSFSVGMTNKW